MTFNTKDILLLIKAAIRIKEKKYRATIGNDTKYKTKNSATVLRCKLKQEICLLSLLSELLPQIGDEFTLVAEDSLYSMDKLHLV